MKVPRPVSRTIPSPNQARPGLRPWLYWLLRFIAGPYLRLGLGISRVRVVHRDRIVSALKQFYSGKNRLILAFRHP
ncbi:MAG: hypothetical protein GW949_06650 [Spirochaetales bacterium]|nr:hypothetical protein [Spirochaetales bacterium]